MKNSYLTNRVGGRQRKGCVIEGGWDEKKKGEWGGGSHRNRNVGAPS